MNKYINKDRAIKIVNTVDDMYPYKVPGEFDTYSKYNEGWTDACDCIRGELEVLPESDVVSADYKQFFDEVSSLPDCNTCADRDCKYMPKPGQVTRFNCPLWRGKDDLTNPR